MITRTTKTVGIFSVLYFAGACALVAFATMETGRLGEQLVSEVRLVANAKAIEEQAAQGKALIAETEGVREQLLEHVLTVDETINFLAEVESAAARQGVTLATQSLTEGTVENSNFDTLVASFSFAGERDAAFRLIRILENLPYESTLMSLGYNEADGVIEGEVTLALSIAPYDQ